MAVLNQRQRHRGNCNVFSACKTASRFWIQLIHRTTAAGFNIVTAVPFEDGDEKQGQTHVGHIYLIAAVAAAPVTDKGGCLVWDLFRSLSDSSDKKHGVPSDIAGSVFSIPCPLRSHGMLRRDLSARILAVDAKTGMRRYNT